MGSGKSSPTRQWFEPENVLRLDVHPRKRVELVAAERGEGGAQRSVAPVGALGRRAAAARHRGVDARAEGLERRADVVVDRAEARRLSIRT